MTVEIADKRTDETRALLKNLDEVVKEWQKFDYSSAYQDNPDGHLKIPHLWPGQNPPPQGRQNGFLFSCFSFLMQVF